VLDGHELLARQTGAVGVALVVPVIDALDLDEARVGDVVRQIPPNATGIQGLSRR